MTEIRIYCDQGHRRWNIATMVKTGEDLPGMLRWSEREVKQQGTGKVKPAHYSIVDQGREVQPPTDGPHYATFTEYPSFTFACPKCRPRRSVPARMNKLQPVLDQMAKDHVEQVSLAELARKIDKHTNRHK